MREEDPCGRCGRLTAHDDLRLHTTRERLREFTRRAPATTPAASPTSAIQITERRVTEPPLVERPFIEGTGAPPAIGRAEAKDADLSLVPSPRLLVAGEKRGRTVSYRWVTHAHVLCPECHAIVQANGGRLHDHDRRRFAMMLLVGLAVAVLIWLSFTTFMPNWIAAFWRNGAGR